MSNSEIAAALADIFDEEFRERDFNNWVELMELDYGTQANPTF